MTGLCGALFAQAPEPGTTESSPSDAQEAPAEASLDIDADKFELIEGRGVADGHVRITYKDLRVEADSVWVEMESKDFSAQGGVKLIRGGYQWDAQVVSGNLDTKCFRFSKTRAKASPWYMAAESARRDNEGVFHLDRVKASTCDHLYHQKWPHWSMSAQYIRRSPDNVYYARHVTIRILGIPVFYLPAIYWDEDWWTPEIAQGREDDWGYWIRLGLSYQYRSLVRGKVFVEHRQKRGEGGGTKGDIRTDRLAIRYLLWGTRDRNPLSDKTVNGDPYNRRYEAEPQHYRTQLFMLYEPWNDFDLRARMDWQSDNDTLFEFFNREYDQNPEPASYLDLSYLRPRYEVALHHQQRVNDFYTAVEELPEVSLQLPRQELADSGLYYQGTTRAGLYRLNFREYDLPRDDGSPDQSDYAAFRADSMHVFYQPLQVGWLSLLPRAGVRATYYSDSSEQPVNDAALVANMNADDRRGTTALTTPVTDYDDLGGDQWRWAHELGMEASFKATRTLPDYRGDWWEMNGLRHVMEPYLNYTYIPQPTEGKEHLYFFDEIDRLDDVNFVRLGLRQHLQTRRGENLDTHSLLSFETYLDYFFDPTDDRAKAGDFGGILSFDPHDAFSSTVKCLLDSHDGRWNIINTQMRLGNESGLHTTVDFFYRNEHTQRYVYSFGSDLTRIFSSGVFPLGFDQNRGLTVNLHVPLTDDLAFSARHYYDLDPPTAQDEELALQRYAFSMNLHCWVAELAYNRNNDDEQVMLTFYLRAFPGTRLAFGETVSGTDDE